MRALYSLFLLSCGALLAASGQQSFTPVSIKVPIWDISVTTGVYGTTGWNNSYSSIYSCTGQTDSDCLLDLADQSKLAALQYAAKTISLGTYGAGAFDLCPGPTQGNGTSSQTHTIYVKGTATIGSNTYYTTTRANGIVTQNASLYDYADVKVSTCKANMQFTSPFTAAKGTPVTITLFPLIRNSVWFDLNVTADTSTGSMCSGSTGGGVCVNYPGLAPYVGTTTATLEAYDTYKTTADTSDQELLLVVDSNGNAFGGMALQTYTPTSPKQSTGAGQVFDGIAQNSDGTFKIDTYGSNPMTDQIGYLRIPNFSRLSAVNTTGSITFLTCSTGKPADATTVNASYKRTK